MAVPVDDSFIRMIAAQLFEKDRVLVTMATQVVARALSEIALAAPPGSPSRTMFQAAAIRITQMNQSLIQAPSRLELPPGGPK